MDKAVPGGTGEAPLRAAPELPDEAPVSSLFFLLLAASLGSLEGIGASGDRMVGI